MTPCKAGKVLSLGGQELELFGCRDGGGNHHFLVRCCNTARELSTTDIEEIRKLRDALSALLAFFEQ